MSHGSVRTPVVPLTELDAREKLARPLLSLCSKHGPLRVGQTVGVGDKTVRDARDEKSSLKLHTAANLLMLDPEALDPILNHFGLRAVPIGAVCSSDGDRTRQSKVLKAALALSVALEDDDEVDPGEVRQNRQALLEARNAIDELLSKDAPKPRLVGGAR